MIGPPGRTGQSRRSGPCGGCVRRRVRTGTPRRQSRLRARGTVVRSNQTNQSCRARPDDPDGLDSNRANRRCRRKLRTRTSALLPPPLFTGSVGGRVPFADGSVDGRLRAGSLDPVDTGLMSTEVVWLGGLTVGERIAAVVEWVIVACPLALVALLLEVRSNGAEKARSTVAGEGAATATVVGLSSARRAGTPREKVKVDRSNSPGVSRSSSVSRVSRQDGASKGLRALATRRAARRVDQVRSKSRRSMGGRSPWQVGEA